MKLNCYLAELNDNNKIICKAPVYLPDLCNPLSPSHRCMVDWIELIATE